MVIDKVIAERKYCDRWISAHKVKKIKALNDRILLESWLGRILILINYFVVRKLVYTTGESFIPNYPVDADKYVVVLTWVAFTIIVLISVIQLIVKNRIYISDNSLSQNEVSYYRYKIVDRFIRTTILVLVYITLYQVFFQFTIKNIDIKTTIIWWIIIVNMFILTYFAWVFSKNAVKNLMLKVMLEEVLEEADKGQFSTAYEKLKKNYSEDSETQSLDMCITLKAIEELMMLSEKTKKTEEKSLLSKSELIANISHDLKTPLTSVINYVDLLSRDNLTNEDKVEYMDILDRKSKRLSTLIKDLKESVGAESGDIIMDAKEVDLSKLLKQVLLEQKERMDNANLDLNLNICKNDDSLKSTVVDENRMIRVLENLISNIIKYSKNNSEVYIKLEQEESLQFEKGYYTRITFKNICDDEITLDVQELMERFRRGDASRNTEGSGLGLDIAKGLLEAQGGELKVSVDGKVFIVDLVV